MGDAAVTNVRAQMHHVDGHDICRVQVEMCIRDRASIHDVRILGGCKDECLLG